MKHQHQQARQLTALQTPETMKKKKPPITIATATPTQLNQTKSDAKDPQQLTINEYDLNLPTSPRNEAARVFPDPDQEKQNKIPI